MTTRWRDHQLSGMAELTYRYVAWLRLPFLVPLLLAGWDWPGHAVSVWFYVTLAAYAAWAVVRLVTVYRPPPGGLRGAVGAAVVDVVAAGTLSALSGGQASAVRYAYYVLPMASVLWQLPRVTAWLGGICVLAYAVLAIPTLANGPSSGRWTVVVDEAYLLWDVLTCVLVAELLRRQAASVGQLLDTRESLLRDALAAETRERTELADALHDSAVQNLLASLHDLEDAQEASPSPALDRVEAEVRRTVQEIRDVTFELHPQVLASIGLSAALRSLGERSARRGGFTVHYELTPRGEVPDQALLYSAARELLNNTVKHAAADNVWLSLRPESGDTVLTVRDDGAGFDPAIIQSRLRDGHIGLASHYMRVESAGGRFTVDSTPGGPTTIEVRLPAQPSGRSPGRGD
ncbi:sensor histidine kinase [Kitasatospora sp. NBC_01302]|uniref:sensor histidine kinase n=1 Tax=Kitasatospora sp. NBC_01302 TaxID=2903575 RepID=UPI002E11E549|nr:ATP-binding protein [Kitasatospora sp. NBC_01302]